MKTCTTIVTCLIMFFQSSAQNNRLTKTEIENWKKDILYLSTELPKRHKNLYHTTSKAVFDSSFTRLVKQLASLSKTAVVFELDKIITKIGDGHSVVAGLLTDPKIGFTYLPLGVYTFSDGTYIYAAGKDYPLLVGAKIIEIGNTKIEDVLQKLNYVIPHDNEMGVLNRTGLFLTTPQVLMGMKVIDDINKVSLTVEVNGVASRHFVTPINSSRPTGDNWTIGWKFSKAADWLDAKKIETPIWLRDPQEYYWSQYIPEHNAMYFAFQGNANKENDPVSAFTKRVFNFIDSAKVDKFILDLRWNYGGNNQLNKSIVVNMIKSYTDQIGKSFTLINRHTFSAAQSLVNALEKYTSTTFIGEPTASNVNFYADPSRITLPSSGITITASSLWWQDMDPRDKRKWKAPQVAVNYTWQNYVSGRDPILQEALAYKPQKSLYDQMLEKITNNDLAGAVTVYNRYKQDPKNIYVQTENDINNLGYYLLHQNKIIEAIEIFKLNTKSYPLSANAYDSLAEAYMLAGNKSLAIENYEKSLKLDPTNFNAAEHIKRLRN